MREYEPSSIWSSRNITNSIAAPSTISTIVPTRRVNRSSCARRLTSLLPEELPRIPFEIANQLAEVAVQLVAREQRARGALAGAEVGHQAVHVIDQAAGLPRRRRRLVGRVDRLVDALL